MSDRTTEVGAALRVVAAGSWDPGPMWEVVRPSPDGRARSGRGSTGPATPVEPAGDQVLNLHEHVVDGLAATLCGPLRRFGQVSADLGAADVGCLVWRRAAREAARRLRRPVRTGQVDLSDGCGVHVWALLADTNVGNSHIRR